MRIRFWGTRGSIPKPGPATLRYGGNTSCVEVRTAGGTLILLDCGTGAHGFGQSLIREPDGPKHGHVLIGHTHWDHIQGLPFLAPLFDSGYEWDIYGPRGLGPSIRETLAGQMQYTYFPITIEQFAARVRYHDLVEGELTIGDATVVAHYMNHPALTLGWRISADGATVVYATDHEPHAPALARGERPPQTADERRHAGFVAGADLLIHDAQFSLAEYANHEGWGHSPVEFAVDLAAANGVRRLALYHHDPTRDDDGVDALVALARRRAAGSGLDVFGAAEGRVVEIGDAATSRAPAPARSTTAGGTAQPAAEVAAARPDVVLAADPGPSRVIAAAVLADGGRLRIAADADDLQRLVAADPPALLIVSRHVDGRDAIDLVAAMRAAAASRAVVPMAVIVAMHAAEIDVDAAAAAGAVDWLNWPFRETYVRTRLQGWMMRKACRWLPAPLPADEAARLRALHDLQILDTPPEERFDRHTRIAAELFDVPAALVSLVDSDRQWFKSHHGLETSELPRDVAFCAHTINGDDVLQVPDTLLDDRFADNPLVTGPMRMRFYAGAPLAAPDGSRIGTLCLIDHRARRLDEQQIGLLRDLAALVEAEIRRH